MKAISLWQPWASLLVTRHGYPYLPLMQPMVKRIETRSWPCPPSIIGARVAFHAAKHAVAVDLGQFNVDKDNPRGTEPAYLLRGPIVWPYRLPLGAIVGSGIVKMCLPIVTGYDLRDPAPHDLVTVAPKAERLTLIRRHKSPTDISDQLPYGDFTPGRWAWHITDAAPCQQRCPWCWGAGGGSLIDEWEDCQVCDGRRRCDPIPAKGRQSFWEWEP